MGRSVAREPYECSAAKRWKPSGWVWKEAEETPLNIYGEEETNPFLVGLTERLPAGCNRSPGTPGERLHDHDYEVMEFLNLPIMKYRNERAIGDRLIILFGEAN